MDPYKDMLRRDAPFDSEAVPEPCGTWDLELDDHGVRYGPGLWPFWSERGGPSQPVPARLAPDTEHRNWRTQYVLVTGVRGEEDGTVDAALVSMNAFVPGQSLGGWVWHLDAKIKLTTLEWAWVVAPPESVAAQAEQKMAKVLQFLRRAVAERDEGQAMPQTAFERWFKAERRRILGPPS